MSQKDYLFNDWHPLCFADQLDDTPLAVNLLQTDLVVWRSGTEVHVWRDRCAHRGSKLSLGKLVDGCRLQCPYHGWEYDAHGHCVHIPAQPGLQPERAKAVKFPVTIGYGLVWTCLGSEPNELPPFPEWQQKTFRKIPCGPFPVATSGPRIIENFLDVAHFPFVHSDILGVAEHAEIADYPVTTSAAGVEATNVRVYQPDPYGTGQGDSVAYTYRAYRPLTAYLLKESAGPQISILLVVTPHTPVTSTAFMWMAMNYAHDTPLDELLGWQNTIFDQDKPVLESQDPQCLPLDPAAEVSIRCDRLAIEYRRWLKQLGVGFGTLP